MSALTLDAFKPTPIWLPWQLRGGSKVPIEPHNRRTYEDAREHAVAINAGSSVGIHLGELPGSDLILCGLDIDGCRDPNGGAVMSWAQTPIDRLRTYAEVSPSGTGIKAFFLIVAEDLPDVLRALAIKDDRRGRKLKAGDSATGGAKAAGFELYTGKRWFAVTFDILPGVSPQLRIIPAAKLGELISYCESVGCGKSSVDRSARAHGIACEIRRAGGDYDAFVEALDDDPGAAAWKAEKGDDRQLERTWAAASREVPLSTVELAAVSFESLPELESASAKIDGYPLTEDGIARAFENRFAGKLIRDCTADCWNVWNGNAWRPDATRRAADWARRTARAFAESPGASSSDKLRLSRASTAEAVERLCRTAEAFVTTAGHWNRDPLLLGTPGGTVDLRTGELLPGNPRDLINKLTAAEPAGDHTPDSRFRTFPGAWAEFLFEVTSGDTDVIEFLRRWFGYCLTGDTREHKLLFVYGPGGNGKSVLIDTVRAIMGEYAQNAAAETFMQSYGDRHSTEIAQLEGARLVTASETEHGRAWAEVRIKQLTGGDPITARRMRENFRTFTPQLKLTIVGNNKPALHNVDAAARRRFLILPFNFVPAQEDKTLRDKLKAEWPQILRWMISGAVDWLRDGLKIPAAIEHATAEYFDSNDTFKQWLAECCEQAAGLSDSTGNLFSSYEGFAHRAGDRPVSRNRAFPELMQRAGFKAAQATDRNRTRVYEGVRVMS